MHILAVHPSAELYGSDRSFAAALLAVDAEIDDIEITVGLPCEGPILAMPIFRKVGVVIENMWIARRADISLPAMPNFLFQGVRRVIQARRNIRRYEFLYIDTLTILDYLIVSILTRKSSAIHIREIPTGFELKIFRVMLLLSNGFLIFNSYATRDAFYLPAFKLRKSYVVYNGAPTPDESYVRKPIVNRPIRVILIGRLNSWKGQEVLVEAVKMMTVEQRRCFEVRIIGSVFSDQNHFRTRLIQAIHDAGLESCVELYPFKDNPAEDYAWADIVVVPSTKPEPFGRVAIEAMSFGCAVIASSHGGLTEIVVDGQTGRLIPPSQPWELSAALLDYQGDHKTITQHGRAGYLRFIDLFTEKSSAEAVVNVFRSIMHAT